MKTDNSGAGTAPDPKCVTVWAPAGENLQSKYGGTDADEFDSATGKYLVKSVTSGGCASCGSTSGSITKEFFYMQLDHGTPDSNEVVWLVVEDTKDGDGNGIRRTVRGTNDAGSLLREVVITDPCGTPAFWCQSKKLVVDTGTKLNCIEESRSPAAHSVTSSTVDEFLNPSHNGDFTNDTSTLQANTGLIRVFEYTSDGDVSGQKIKQGRSGTAYYVAATDYLGGSNANQKHLVTYQYVFPQAETSRTAATRIATQYSYTFWMGTDTIQTLTATYPNVSSSENLYDKRGRVYRTKTYAVNPTSGAVGSALVSDTWLDAAGRTLKQQGASSDAFSKLVYDGLGRVTKQYTAYDTDETAYTDADDVTGDTVLEQSVVTYDVNGNAIQSTSYQRKHTEAGTGELTTSSARVTYTASWFDGANRTTASANYGSNGGAAFSRPSTAPARSDTVLVTSTEYNSAGQAYKTTDPMGKESRVEFDDAGRTLKQIGSYVDGNPATGGSDEDVTVEMAYNADGQVTTLTAKNPTTGDQITKYVYGTATGGITPEVYRNDLLRAEIYPDSDDTTSLGNGADGTYDRIEFTYDIQGGRLDRKDQNGTVHTYDMDKAGRVTHDRVTTLGAGVDGTVRRVSTTYEIRGLRDKITTYDNATVGSGTALTELVYEYNDLGMPTKEYQEHEGVKDASTLYVGYNYDTTVVSGEYMKGLRPTSVRYPNSRLVHLTYGTTGANGDALGRVESIKDDSGGSPGTSFSDYSYLGSGTIVVEDFAQPDVKLNYDSGTAGTYAGFDRFGRVVDQLWYDYGASADRDRFTYGYDRASSRLYRENTVASAKDEYYTYDDVNRLATFDRGDLDAGKTAISGTPVKEEDWALDMTGNWTDFLQKTSGTTDLNQDRAHNPVNEITGITETVGTAWVDPVHDQAGNMTTMPKPSSLNTALTCTWDAWNRLVEVKQGAVVMGRYEYDALGRRVKSHVDSQSPGSPNGVDAYVHYFYNSGWQELESRVSASENTGPESLQPTYQYVWSRRYIDAPVLRDKNTDADGLCDDERIYYLGDANFNITTLVNTGGDAIERYVYTPYGVLTVYDATWANIRSTSNYANAYTYTGRQLDAETGLYYYRARVYAPQLGRFVSRDPVGYDAGYSLCLYADNSPNSMTDPFGRETISIGFPEDKETIVADWWNWLITDETISIDPNHPNWPGAKDELDRAVDDCCVHKVIFNGHGDSCSFGPFNPGNINNTSDEADFLNRLKVKLCKPCLVEVRHCFVGGNKAFMLALAKKLDCDVKGIDDWWAVTPHGNEYVYHPDGTCELTACRPKWSPGDYKKGCKGNKESKKCLKGKNDKKDYK